MMSQPSSATAAVRTKRLTLRPLRLEDADELKRCMIEGAIGETMISTPDNVNDESARAWIAARLPSSQSHDLHLAICESADDRRAIGYVGVVHVDPVHGEGELTFWLGRDARGKGYASEAAKSVAAHALGPFGLNRLCAHHMVGNDASGGVLARLGFKPEGVLRQRVRKRGAFHDVALLSLLRDDLNASDGDIN